MDSDSDLYRLWLAKRDEAAFATLARRHADLVADVAWRASGDLATAEDALQDALLALARDGTDRPAEIGVRAWLARAAISRAKHARDSERARGRRERAMAGVRVEAAMDAKPDDATTAVHQSIARLDGDSATVLALRYLHGVEYVEMAAILDVEEATARVRVHRALETLRADAKRGDLDERRLAVLLLAAPRAVASSAQVEAAVAAALSAAGAGGAAVATTAVAGIGRKIAWAVAGLVLAGAGAVLLPPLFARGASSVTAPKESAADGLPPTRPGLTGRDAPRVASTPNGNDSAPQKAPPDDTAPVPVAVRSSSPRRDDTVAVAVRMEIARPGGATEEIPIASIYHKGITYDAERLRQQGGTIRTSRGWIVNVTTADPRAAFATVRLRVPDPPPAVLVARVPAAEDPRLQTLVLEAVDAGSRSPVPAATLEWDPAFGARDSQSSGADGRISIALPADSATRGAFVASLQDRICIHAAGYRPFGGYHRPRTKDPSTGVEEADVLAWLDRGVWQIALEPVREGEATTERAVRFVDGEGRPVVGVYVAVVRDLPPQAMKVLKALGAAATPGEMGAQGFRQSDAKGVIRFPMLDMVGLEMRIDDVPFAAWGLAAENWPSEGPREIRVPERCDIEIAIDGLPEGTRVGWSRDRLGAARSLMDGPSDGQHITLDPAAVREVAAGGMFPVWLQDVGGTLEKGRPTLPLAAGEPCRLYFWANQETRTLDVKPESPGATTVTRRWDELPILHANPGRIGGADGGFVPGKK